MSIPKRSIIVDGNRTSVSLEDAFWDRLKKLAHDAGLSLNDYVTGIASRSPGHTNLSSAIRVAVLKAALEQQAAPAEAA